MNKLLVWLKNNKSLCYLTIGLIFIIWCSIYLFTRPSLFSIFDLSDKGQIGDTIGGISAPIINLFGAILVYLSFKVQINANKIQFEILNKEMNNRKVERNFEITLNLFTQLKEDYWRMSLDTFTGKRAINVFVNKLNELKIKEDIIKHFRKNIYSEFIFIINEYKQLITRIENVEMNLDEKRQLFYIIYSFYGSYISYSARILRKKYQENGIHENEILLMSDIIESHKRIIDTIKK